MTVLDAFDLAVCDDAELGRRGAAGDAQARNLKQWEIPAAIGCAQMQVSRIIRTSLERLSAHASMACGGWSMSDITEGATA